MQKIAYIGTGGTIASLGADDLDLLDYTATDIRVTAAEVIERSGLQGRVAQIVPVNFRQIDSTAITLADWSALAILCQDLAGDASLDGIVIGHGTASLEETAFLLSLVLNLTIPVVLTGSMRPLNGISTDAFANLAGAFQTAAALVGRGDVVVVMNDEVYAARSVSKAHTLKLDAFRAADGGPIGHVIGSAVSLDRAPHLRHADAFGLGIELIATMPRVDIVYSHVGADGVPVRACVAAGARGLVSAGFGPGMATPDQTEALQHAIAGGVTVVQSSRTGAGQVVDGIHHRAIGIIAGSDLNPQKARILLALCLARGDGPNTIAEMFSRI